MAEILGLGISHYPPLAGPDERMAMILKRMLQNPDLPAELRTSKGWPAAMQKEWGADEGLTSAAIHRETLVGEMRKVRKALDDFKPDFVLMWGDDQYENFKEDVIPPYCINAYDSFEFGPLKGNVWNETDDKLYKLPGCRKEGKYLASALLREGFDAAYSYKPLHDELGHAFTNAIFYLDYDRKGFNYPILPVTVNSYGRHVISQKGGLPTFDKVLTEEDLDPPAPSPQRLFDMGAATARVLAASPWRVALMASSGWSHAFLTAKNNFLWPDTPSDRGLYDALRAGDYKTWRNYPAEAIEACGQQEVLNWSCLAGALHELNRKPKETSFVDTWIFNSSKCFLIAPPA
jgi:Catalytic LigB subunit of aromatic ring-opening dioxygenase